MKISSSFLGLIIAAIVLVLSLWIYFQFIAKQAIYAIDNPTENSINITLNDNDYILAPEQFVEIQLNKGENLIHFNDKKSNFTVEKVRGVLNPTKSVYVIFSMPYGPGLDVDSIFRSQETVIEGKTYFGKIRLDSSLYIEDYYYGLDEKFPNLVMKSEYDSLKRRDKIFRLQEFKQFYFQNFE